MTASQGTAAGYDAQVLNDFRALPTTPSRPAPVGALVDISSILGRAGRLPWPRRIIIAVADDGAHGVRARIDADRTQVLITSKGPGLLIYVTPRDQVNAEALEISLADTVIRQPRTHGDRP